MHTFALKKTMMLALVAGAALSRPAFAESYSFTQLADGGGTIASVATLSITTVTGGNGAQFTLTGTFGWLGNSAYLGGISFNGPDGTATHISGNLFKDKGEPTYSDKEKKPNWEANYPNSNNEDRFLAADYSTWQILGSGITSASFGRPMMVHIQGLAGNQLGLSNSIKVLSPIPEPETYAMFLAGLGLMGFIARRRRTA